MSLFTGALFLNISLKCKSIKNNRSFNFTKPLLIFLNKKIIYQEFLNMKAW